MLEAGLAGQGQSVAPKGTAVMPQADAECQEEQASVLDGQRKEDGHTELDIIRPRRLDGGLQKGPKRPDSEQRRDEPGDGVADDQDAEDLQQRGRLAPGDGVWGLRRWWWRMHDHLPRDFLDRH